jgi:hypothetical protein
VGGLATRAAEPQKRHLFPYAAEQGIHCCFAGNGVLLDQGSGEPGIAPGTSTVAYGCFRMVQSAGRSRTLAPRKVCKWLPVRTMQRSVFFAWCNRRSKPAPDLPVASATSTPTTPSPDVAAETVDVAASPSPGRHPNVLHLKGSHSRLSDAGRGPKPWHGGFHPNRHDGRSVLPRKGW